MHQSQLSSKRKLYALRHTVSYLNDLKKWSLEFNTIKASDAFKNIDDNQENIKKALSRIINSDSEIPPEVVRDYAVTICEYYDKRNLWQEWLELGSIGLAACRQLADDYSMGEAYAIICNSLGLSYRMLSNYEKAVEFYQEALDFSQKNELTSSALVNMADIYRLKKKYQEALDYAELAIQLGDADKNCKAKGFEYKGLTYRSLKEYDKAVDYLKAAVDLRRETGNLPRLAVVLEFLSSALTEWGGQDNLQLAEVYIINAIQIAKELKDNNLIGASSYSLGITYLKLEKYDKAIDIFLEVCNYRRDVVFPRGEACLKIEMAYCYLQCGCLKEAIVYAQAVYKYRDYMTQDDRVKKSHQIILVFGKVGEYLKGVGCLSEGEAFLELARNAGSRG